MVKMLRMISLVTMGCGFALLSAGDAEAVSTTVYSGLTCVKTPSSQGTLGTYLGTVSNTGSQTLNVMCPVPHTPSSSINSAKILVFDRSQQASVVCTISNESFKDSPVFQDQESAWTTPQGYNEGTPTELSFPTISTSTNSTFTQTYVTCDLPGSTSLGVSHLATIQVTES